MVLKACILAYLTVRWELDIGMVQASYHGSLGACQLAELIPKLR